MKVTGRALPSTHDNVSNDVVGGRKTLQSIGGSKEEHEGGVLVNVVGADDAVIFSDEVVDHDESYPSLDDTSDDDDDDETEEESSEEESEEEEEYDEGKFSSLRVGRL